MRRYPKLPTVMLRVVLAVTIAGSALLVPAAPASAAAQIVGSGSTWSQLAVDQWRADVAAQGLSVNYQGNGSSTGRQFYIQAQTDFGVSEIPFQPASFNRDGQKLYDEIEAASKRPYAYLPIVAGGTAFMYHLDVAGNRVTDLHLSGRTIARIFTGQITNWNHPDIAKDDGRTFPDLPITPVLRSDGSGTSAQFTQFMAETAPDVWDPFCTQALNLPSPCPSTSLYPYFATSKAQTGSDGVANFVSAPYNNGSITYVEYGYALQREFPVVSVLNQAGYFVQPTAENVAIALTKARINPDRTQVLSDVYRNPDPRAYPVSSYSYMIVPTTTDAPFSTDKGDTLGKFILYFLCTGQQKAKQLGYSPLPANLVGFGFDAVSLIPGAPAPPPIEQCANPTITGEFSLQNAPAPSASDRAGAERPAIAGAGPAAAAAPGGAVTQSNAGTGNAAAGPRRSSGNSTSGTTGTTIAGDPAATPTAELDARAARRAGDTELVASEQSLPTSVRRGDGDVPAGIYVAITLMVLLVVFGPTALGVALRRRRPG